MRLLQHASEVRSRARLQCVSTCAFFQRVILVALSFINNLLVLYYKPLLRIFLKIFIFFFKIA